MTAVENEHADCIDCHESGPVSGGSARLRMAVAYDAADEATIFTRARRSTALSALPRDIESEIAGRAAGLRVSHKEILASGRTCSDCHRDVGHTAGRSFQGGMSSCTVCHDGKTAASECETCHAGGSPLEAVRTVGSSAASFAYSPVQVANRDCSRCHGRDQKCLDCHNGFVLPHPDEFRNGGHGRYRRLCRQGPVLQVPLDCLVRKRHVSQRVLAARRRAMAGGAPERHQQDVRQLPHRLGR